MAEERATSGDIPIPTPMPVAGVRCQNHPNRWGSHARAWSRKIPSHIDSQNSLLAG